MINKARIVENSKKALQIMILRKIEINRLIERKREKENMKYLGEVYIVFLFVMGKFCSLDVSTQVYRREREMETDRQIVREREIVKNQQS